MVGIYRISNIFVFGGICHFPHRPLCNYCNTAVFFPRTRQRNRQEILLANNHRRNRCGNSGHRPNQFILNTPTKRWVFFYHTQSYTTHKNLDYWIDNMSILFFILAIPHPRLSHHATPPNTPRAYFFFIVRTRTRTRSEKINIKSNIFKSKIKI